MLPMQTIQRSVLLAFLFASITLAVGQTNQLETDKGIAASIAPYEADVRQAILLASQYPQVLTALNQSQTKSVANFQKIIKDYRQSKQVWFYTLTRYPDLIHKLATLPEKQSKEDIQKLLPNKQADLLEAAWETYRNEKKVLIEIDNAQIAAQQDFEKTIQPLSPAVNAAFKKLYVLPDVLTLMTNNISLTTRLGEHYKSNPEEVSNRLSALHDSLNVQNQYETEALKKQMDEDPQAATELSQAAKDYASENGYDPPTQQNDGMDNGDSYYADPYSYWFGYPYWYGSPLWYPGSFWYESGFYMGLGGFGFYGFPSYGFANWFFAGGHYNHYPHLYTQFGNYYRNNRAGNRVMGGANHGFMSVAAGHYNPKGAAQMNRLTSPAAYKRSASPANGNAAHTTGTNTRSAGTNTRSAGSTSHSNANSYHAQSWGSYGGRAGSVGGGGGGSRGGGGGGRR